MYNVFHSGSQFRTCRDLKRNGYTLKGNNSDVEIFSSFCINITIAIIIIIHTYIHVTFYFYKFAASREKTPSNMRKLRRFRYEKKPS